MPSCDFKRSAISGGGKDRERAGREFPGQGCVETVFRVITPMAVLSA